MASAGTDLAATTGARMSRRSALMANYGAYAVVVAAGGLNGAVGSRSIHRSLLPRGESGAHGSGRASWWIAALSTAARRWW
jgi:hypothetical protein